MWTNCNEPYDQCALGALIPLDTLIFYDGPKLFSFKNRDGNPWLAYYLDDGEQGELFLTTPVDPSDFAQLTESRIPIRDVLLGGQTLVVAEVFGQSVVKAMTIRAAAIPEALLPKASQLLPFALKNLTLAIKVSSNRLDLTLLQRILGPLQRMISRAAEAICQTSPRLVPATGRAGSFILDVKVAEESRISGESFIQAWKQVAEGPTAASADDWAELATILSDDNASLVVNLETPNGSIDQLELTKAHLDRVVEKIREATHNRQAKLTSAEVPQANDLDKILKLVELTAEKFVVSYEEIGVTSVRQFQYYRDAAWLMGLMDGMWPTPVGRMVAKLPKDRRYPVVAMLFESSRLGQAWLSWSNSSTLLDIDANSARRFLSETTVGLSEDTVKRRASSIKNWANKLKGNHYLLNNAKGNDERLPQE